MPEPKVDHHLGTVWINTTSLLMKFKAFCDVHSRCTVVRWTRQKVQRRLYEYIYLILEYGAQGYKRRLKATQTHRHKFCFPNKPFVVAASLRSERWRPSVSAEFQNRYRLHVGYVGYMSVTSVTCRLHVGYVGYMSVTSVTWGGVRP